MPQSRLLLHNYIEELELKLRMCASVSVGEVLTKENRDEEERQGHSQEG